MASLPYPLNRLYTHIVSVIATTQSAVHSYCQCDCHHSIGLYTHVCVGMAGMPYPPTDTHSSVFQKPVLLFFCLSPTTCSHVLLSFQTTTCSHVLLSFQTTTCSHVLLSFQTTTCSHVLMSSKQKPVLMFSCLSKKHVLLSSKKNHVLHPILSLCRQKKTAESNAPSR